MFLMEKVFGMRHRQRKKAIFKRGVDGQRENSGNEAMGEVVARSGILELNIGERKQLWGKEAALGEVSVPGRGPGRGW